MSGLSHVARKRRRARKPASQRVLPACSAPPERRDLGSHEPRPFTECAGRRRTRRMMTSQWTWRTILARFLLGALATGGAAGGAEPTTPPLPRASAEGRTDLLVPPAPSILDPAIRPIDLNTALELAGVQNPDLLIARQRVVE